MLSRRILTAVAVLVALAAATLCLTSCDPTGPTAGPNKGQLPDRQCVSTQSWWQKAHVFGFTKIPQELPASGVGGHLHVEVCFPVNARVDGDQLTLTVHIKTHQRFTGVGDRIDVGLAPNGDSLIEQALAWDSRCPTGMCHTSAAIAVPLSAVPDGLQILRIRYLPARHPNGDRQFASNELPFFHNTAPSGCPKATEGKGWYDDQTHDPMIEYARAGVNGCLPGNTPVSGSYTLRQRYTSTNYDIGVVEAYMDARFGADVFATKLVQFVPPAGDGVGSSSERVSQIDTTRFPDGWHCLSVLTSTKALPGSDAVLTGVQEFPILIDNPGGPADASTVEYPGGACFVNG